MNLFPKLQKRDTEQNPIRIGMIGAGKFGSMFLAQANRLPGIHVIGIADLNPSNACSNLAYVGWSAEKYAATSLDDAMKTGTSFVGDDWQALVSHPAIDMIIECTGDPVAAVHHVITAFDHGKMLLMQRLKPMLFAAQVSVKQQLRRRLSIQWPMVISQR